MVQRTRSGEGRAMGKGEKADWRLANFVQRSPLVKGDKLMEAGCPTLKRGALIGMGQTSRGLAK